jgi:hypothetical protein
MKIFLSNSPTLFSDTENFKKGTDILNPYNYEITGATGYCIVTTQKPVSPEDINILEECEFLPTSETKFMIPLFAKLE